MARHMPRLRDRRLYEEQVDRLHRRYLLTRQLHELEQDEVSLATVVMGRRKIARLLARTVARGEYRSEPATMRRITVEGKEREVFAYRLTDCIVHGAVAALVEDAMAGSLSPRLFSYRKGISWWAPISEFAEYVRRHRRERPDPRTRGLYVLRRDIDSYTDSIPVGPTSPVWPMLRELLADTEMGASDWQLLERVVRPQVADGDGAVAELIRGVATGQPISCVLFNFYLGDLDRAVDSIPGGFYARYSDDVIFAHPDPDVVAEADARMQRVLRRLDLEFKPTKSLDLYVTGAGRSSDVVPDAKGTTRVPFLGTSIAADGAVSLSPTKLRGLLRDLEYRARVTARSLHGASLDDRGRRVCEVINRALDPRAALFQQRSATLLRRAVTDRSHLAQVDYWIARIVLRAVTGRSDVRAFRDVPYRRLREQWRLISLEHERNRWGRGRPRRGEGAASTRSLGRGAGAA